jgi:hypothetical protein
MPRTGQNRYRYTPYTTVCLANSLPNMPDIHRIFMVPANPKYLHGTCFLALEARVCVCTLQLCGDERACVQNTGVRLWPALHFERTDRMRSQQLHILEKIKEKVRRQ